jgi:hypothetical protein
MKKLFLHIGCGKTGSSALQVWLWNNSEVFFENGVFYPIDSGEKLDEYAITSGNGVSLVSACESGRVKAYLASVASLASGKNILLSSERFQALKEDTLKDLRMEAERLGYQVIIIAFVRDVYDFAYSSYVQLVKRHGLIQTFREFNISRKTMQQFEVVKEYRKCFKDIEIINYEEAKIYGLDKALLGILGVCVDQPMSPKKVNRSLTVKEVETLRAFNKSVKDLDLPPKIYFSISDLIIKNSPEKEVDILLDEGVVAHFEAVFKEDLALVNQMFPESSKKLKTFDPSEKLLNRGGADIDPEVTDTLQCVFEALSPSLSHLGASEQGKKIEEKDVISFLVGQAVKRESVNLSEALDLVKAAAVFRKNGPIINKKIEEYTRELGPQ